MVGEIHREYTLSEMFELSYSARVPLFIFLSLQRQAQLKPWFQFQTIQVTLTGESNAWIPDPHKSCFTANVTLQPERPQDITRLGASGAA